MRLVTCLESRMTGDFLESRDLVGDLSIVEIGW